MSAKTMVDPLILYFVMRLNIDSDWEPGVRKANEVMFCYVACVACVRNRKTEQSSRGRDVPDVGCLLGECWKELPGL